MGAVEGASEVYFAVARGVTELGVVCEVSHIHERGPHPQVRYKTFFVSSPRFFPCASLAQIRISRLFPQLSCPPWLQNQDPAEVVGRYM
jgi:hypothetical protein